MKIQTKILTVSVLSALNSYAMACHNSDKPSCGGGITTPKPVYETRYRLINTQRPLNYTDAYGAAKRQYPREALAILWMYQNQSADSKYYIDVANFKYRTNNYQYTSESRGDLRVSYSNRGGTTAANLTHAPSLATSSAANEAAGVKTRLLAYLNAKDFSALNFNFEQQFNLRECSWNANVWSCKNGGKKRMLVPFKLVKGQDPSEAGSFYGASVEPDPDDNTIISTPEAKAKDGATLNVTYYVNDPFPDFYKQQANADALSPYEPANENYVLTSMKRTEEFGGWFIGERVDLSGAKSAIDFDTDYGSYTFKDEIPIYYAITSGSPDPRQNVVFDCSTLTDQADIDICLQEQTSNPPVSTGTIVYDLLDRYQTMQTSMKNSTQCFFPERDGSSSCTFDASELLNNYQATKLNLTIKSRFILDKIKSASFNKQISYDYCLSPVLAETVSAQYQVKQLQTTRSYMIDTNGQMVNTTASNDLTPVNVITLPESVNYAINNFKWERNSIYTDTATGQSYNTDDIFSQKVLDITQASLYEDEEDNIYVGNTQFMDPETGFSVQVNKTGNDDSQKAWSCDESFLPYVQAELNKVNQMCGTTPKVVNYSLTKDNGTGMCKAEYTSNDGCENNPIVQETTTETPVLDPTTGEALLNPDGTPQMTSTTTTTSVDNYQWTTQSTIAIPLPENGLACSETCFVNDGVKTSGYCAWREESTGRKYHP